MTMTETMVTRRWVEESPVGPLTVTVGEAGIRSVEIGVPPIATESAADEAVSSALRAYFAGDLAALDGLEVDLDGRSRFCRQVLTALRHVGPGRVVSYGRLGAQIGHPRAARAVGRALGCNPVPIVVPCHRVVAGDGTLGGYSGGLATKRWLLAHEGRA